MISIAKVTNLRRLSIVECRVKKVKKIKTSSKVVYTMCVLLVIGILFFGFRENYSTLINDMMTIYSPITSLYSDKNDILFTGGVGLVEDTEFTLPLLSKDVKVVEGNIIIRVDSSVMLKSIARGVVEDINTSIDNVKYIKVKHTDRVYSIIENIDVATVKTNEIVDKDNYIATLSQNENIVVKIYKDNIQIKDIKVEGNKIIADV